MLYGILALFMADGRGLMIQLLALKKTLLELLVSQLLKKYCMLSLRFSGPPTHRGAATATLFRSVLTKPLRNLKFAIKTNAFHLFMLTSAALAAALALATLAAAAVLTATALAYQR